MHDPFVAVVHFLKAIAQGTVSHVLKEESNSKPHLVVLGTLSILDPLPKR